MKSKLYSLVLSILFVLTACATNSNASRDGYHTITFNSNGGTSIKSIKVKHNEKIPTPAEPTKDKWVFAGWELFNGKVDREPYEIVNGEAYYNDEYMQGDGGYYLALSDLTFKANWAKLGNIDVWHTLGTQLLPSSDLENKVNLVAQNMNVDFNVSFKGDYKDLEKALEFSAAIGNGPCLIVLPATECVNESDIDKLYYQYNPSSSIDAFLDYYIPLSADSRSYVLNHFDSSIYKYVQDDDRILGFPLCSFDTMLFSKEEAGYDYNIPGRTHLFAFINKLQVENPNYSSSLRILTEKFAKQLSQSYLEA